MPREIASPRQRGKRQAGGFPHSKTWTEIRSGAEIVMPNLTPNSLCVTKLRMKARSISPAVPFRTKLKRRWLPREMREPPLLEDTALNGPVTPRRVLLINPFYAKDPHASFGKHVLTPTLALTSIAASTPPEWSVRYWDENLLHGPPPFDPFPEVVGITVHLTFAQRAFALARWYRERGAKIVLGSLHVISRPEECAPHADALAAGEGVQIWGAILRDV